MAADERVADDDFNFWALHIPRPWSRVVAEAIAEHDQGAAPQPTPEDLSALSMAEYAALREQYFGIRDSNGILGAEVQPWQRTTTIERNEL